MTERITVESMVGETITQYATRLINEVKRSDDPRNTIVYGRFNGIELNANMYTHKNYLLGQYDRMLTERNNEQIRKEKLEGISENMNRINSILNDIERKQ